MLVQTNEGAVKPPSPEFTLKGLWGPSERKDAAKGQPAWGQRRATDYEIESGKRIDQYGVEQAGSAGFREGAVKGLAVTAPLAAAGPVGWAIIGAAAIAGGFMGKSKAVKGKIKGDVEAAKQRDVAAVSVESQAAVKQRDQRAQSDAKTRAGKAPKKKTDDQVLASGMAQPPATAGSGRTKSDRWHSGTFGS